MTLPARDILGSSAGTRVEARFRFEALDSWRGLCALWIVLYHFRALSHVYDWVWVRTGDIAVDFFFVLSGFVISHAYRGKLVAGAERLQFLIRRFGRLYPLHIVTLLVVVGLESGRWLIGGLMGHSLGGPPFSADTNLVALPANVLLVHAWGFFRDFTWNIPSWSISVEWGLCLVFAALSTLRRTFLITALLALSGAGVTLWMSSLPGYPPEGHTALVRGVYGFFLGALTYRLFMYMIEKSIRIPGWVEWIGPGLLLLTVLFKRAHMPVVCPLLFAALVLIFASQTGPLSKLLLLRPFRWLGEISYSIYLVHYVLVLILFGAAVAIGPLLHVTPLVERGPFNAQLLNMPNLFVGDFAALLFVALTVGAAAISYRFVETPGRSWFNRFSVKVSDKLKRA